jgi:hypothetical protein
MNQIRAYIEHDGVPFLNALRDPTAFAEKVQLISSNPNDVHVLESMAYSYILIGKYDKAASVLHHLQDRIPHVSIQTDWVQELGERAQRVGAALAQDPRAALALLDEWRQQTVDALRLVDKTHRGHSGNGHSPAPPPPRNAG